MTPPPSSAEDLADALRADDLAAVSALLQELDPLAIAEQLERLERRDRAIVYRLLPRDRALAVFEMLDAGMRAELFSGLRDEDVAQVFERLDPDDRAQLVDELPAGVAQRLLRELSPEARELSAPMLGFPRDSIGRYMSTEFVRLEPTLTAGDALSHLRLRGRDAESIYMLPVTTAHLRVVGVVSLRTLLLAPPDATVSSLMVEPRAVTATDLAERAARATVDARLLAAPVVDGEGRLLGILTVDDAARILEEVEDVDAARQGGAEPLGRPYLASSVMQIVRARGVWLLVLAVSALLTVQVLDFFEATLAQVVTLALFIPLLTGTAGNTGSQAATTVTRALALGEVGPRDALRVAWREVRVGLTLGSGLGALGFAFGSLAFDPVLGLVIGLTLVFVCTLAATVGGLMPLVARALGADPAVFSTPFISTFCDATSLVIYFAVATWLLGL
jgi:Mg2+ transporter (mgtE)